MLINSFPSVLSKYGKLITGILWLASTLIYLNIHGVVTELEASKYIEEAHRYINTGSFSAPRFYFYSATIFIMAFAIKVNSFLSVGSLVTRFIKPAMAPPP